MLLDVVSRSVVTSSRPLSGDRLMGGRRWRRDDWEVSKSREEASRDGSIADL